MKQAVIQTGGKQYLVQPDQELDVELLDTKKDVTFTPLMVIDGDKVSVGAPEVSGASVSATVVDEVKGDKVLAIRYKAKKRVHTVRGHRQKYSRIKITDIK